MIHTQKIIWSTGCVLNRKNEPVRRAFLEWHRAHLLDLSIEKCQFDGRVLDAAELFRLNFWIRAQGAWRCSLLPLPKAHEVVSRVVFDGLRVPVGRARAGRLRPGSADMRAFDRSLVSRYDSMILSYYHTIIVS